MKHNRNSALLRILGLLKGCRAATAGTMIFAALTVVTGLAVPVLVGRAVDAIAGAGQVDYPSVLRNLVGVACFTLLSGISQWIMSLLNNRITYHTVRNLRCTAFRKLMRLPISYADSNKLGELVSRLITDIDTFADGLLLGFTQLFSGIATIVCTLGFMAAMSPAITLAVAVLTPLSLFVARFISKRTYRMFTLQSRTRAEQTAFVDEMISAQKTVKAFSYETISEARFEEINRRLGDCAQKAVFYSSLTNPCTRFVNALVYAAVALFGGLSVINGGFSVGMLVSFLSYANKYTKPFNEISGVIAELQNALACARRVFRLLDEPEQSAEPEQPTVLPQRGAVSFRDVSFSYTPEQRLISHFSAEVRPGQQIAIVGPTGCGKTTLINLLMRFYDPVSGAILIDGIPTVNMPRETVRSLFGMVLQETWLKSGTIAENLRIGKPDATTEEMTRACEATRAMSFIRRLPDGFQTQIGEGGGALSEGQKQLLCITRVLLMNPPILILDEATSSIDTRTELIVQKAFRVLMEGKTSFVVAHRLSTIMEADCIFVMKDGNILERGTHEELLRHNGFYKTLYESQFAK